jgi:hypothetical protein
MGSNGLPDCSNGYRDATALMQGGKLYENLGEGLSILYLDFASVGSFHFVADLPALFIILITALVYRGMKESRMQ